VKIMDLTQPDPSTTPRTHRTPSRAFTAAIVGLTLATAYIHLSLGGLLFTLNAAGYAAIAAATVVAATVSDPLVRRFDWLPRVGLAGYTVTTIGAYLVMGPYFGLGWMAKGIEVAILTLLVIDVYRTYGSPVGLIRAALDSVGLGPRSRPMGA
jgi:hypothetical protein